MAKTKKSKRGAKVSPMGIGMPQTPEQMAAMMGKMGAGPSMGKKAKLPKKRK